MLIPTAAFQCKSMGALQGFSLVTLVKRRAEWAVLRGLAPLSSDSPQSRHIEGIVVLANVFTMIILLNWQK